VPPVTAEDGKREGSTIELASDAEGPLAALVFKIVAEKPVDLYYLRVYSGRLKPNMRLLNSVTGEKENVSRIYQMFAKRRDQLNEAVAGDIVAVIGPKNALTGHTLCDQRRSVILESISFPETVISVSVEPRSAKDRDKLFEALRGLERQDPTISITSNTETGQTLISGMGELHVEIVVQRLRSDAGVEVSVGKPRVAYRETVTRRGTGSGQFDRQIGGRRHAANVRVSIEPREHVAGRANFEVVGQPSEDVLGAEAVEAVETGIMDGARSGVLGGYPVIDWKVNILEAAADGNDGTVVAYESAARLAFESAMAAASPVLLQPIMQVEVVTAEEYFGAIMGDLTSRHAVVTDTLIRGTNRIICARAPLSQMTGYVTRLRSISQGRATSSMSPSHYSAVPETEMKILVG
jgi:elongation factor G